MTEFTTQAGEDIGYRLVFRTDDKDKFLYMQEQARECVDNKYKEKPVEKSDCNEKQVDFFKYAKNDMQKLMFIMGSICAIRDGCEDSCRFYDGNKCKFVSEEVNEMLEKCRAKFEEAEQ